MNFRQRQGLNPQPVKTVLLKFGTLIRSATQPSFVPHLVLTDTLTLCQSKMADYTHHNGLAPPDLKMFH